MKHILIDGRLYGPKHTGIGRYTKNLLISLKNLPDFSRYRFSLLVYPELLSEIKEDLQDNFCYLVTNIRHYSLSEQLFLPFLIYHQKPDLVHFTHFNKPLLYFGKSVVTIHDLIKHFFKGKETTTRNQFFYWFKYIAYKLLIFISIKNNFIIVPSNFWRKYLIDNYQLPQNRVSTTYEAVDPKFLSASHQFIKIPKNYLIYTGNLYPHKNIQVILDCLKLSKDLKLKVISARNYFWEKLTQSIKILGLENQVEFLGFVPDKDFKSIYSHAIALVHPSLAEGFSLTGLEAMALNCPVLSSTSTCLPEIYQNAVLYFNPHNPDNLLSQINKLKKSPCLRSNLIKKGHLLLSKYSWTKTATSTLNIYKKLLDQ